MMAKVGRGRRARWLVLSSSSSAGPLVHVQHTNAAHSVDGVKIVVSFRFGPARGERMRGRTPLRYVIISSLRTAEAGGGQGPAWRDGGVSGRRSGQRAYASGCKPPVPASGPRIHYTTGGGSFFVLGVFEAKRVCSWQLHKAVPTKRTLATHRSARPSTFAASSSAAIFPWYRCFPRRVHCTALTPLSMALFATILPTTPLATRSLLLTSPSPRDASSVLALDTTFPALTIMA